ncbi:MAG: hypothetical protein RDU20_23215 [Desulfomonilaceae bacterium]|nr:hypothetical protein [Desulfomonilaceae bacterium]
MNYIKRLIKNGFGPPLLSPLRAYDAPDSVLFAGGQDYERLFSGRIIRRSPGDVRRRGLLDRLLHRMALRKIDADAARNYDISLVLYPMGMDLAAWGTVVDRVGRVFHASSRYDGKFELLYEGGCCRSVRDWRILVGTRRPDDDGVIRTFYNRAGLVAADRVVLGGTVGFGLWDALWMSFDFSRATEILECEPDFVKLVFRYWKEFHLCAVHAMLDAGTKLIFLREHPGGFPWGRDMASRLDPFLGEHLRDLSRAVRSRGGCFFLDCSAWEFLETDYPHEWGFDGVGPMFFDDASDLESALTGLPDDLVLVGSLADPRFSSPRLQRIKSTERVVLTEKPGEARQEDFRDTQVIDPADATYSAGSVWVSA